VVDSTLNAVVLERQEITPELIVLRVRPVGWELSAFTPGQFAVLRLPGSARRHPLADPEEEIPDPGKLIRRSYSIASSSVSTEFLEFFVTLVHSGCLTPRLFALEPGDHVWLGPKITGTFTLDVIPEESHLVMVATGTGLAPYMSMLRTRVPEETRKVSVLLGARHSWDLGYRAELAQIMKRAPNVFFDPTISRPGAEREPWSGRVGYV
jgi:ferredoxin--NADP+ reductase